MKNVSIGSGFQGGAVTCPTYHDLKRPFLRSDNRIRMSALRWILLGLLALLATSKVVARFKAGVLRTIEQKLGKRTILFLGVLLVLAVIATHVVEALQHAGEEKTRVAEEKRQAAEAEAKRPTYIGTLDPAADPMPQPAFEVGPNAVLLLLGSFQVWTTNSAIHTLRCRSTDFIELGIQDGHAWVSANVVDSSGRRIVRVIHNDFEATPGVAFYPRKLDASTYVVRDFEGVEVLRLRYMNPRAIRLTGRFVLPSGGVFEIGADELRIAGQHFIGGGSYNGNTAFNVCG